MAAGGFLCLVLHAHLPFVRHPERDEFLEEDWFFEAITESYLPLLEVFANLERDGVRYRVTVSLSPPLLAMLSDALLLERYERHLGRLIDLAEREVVRTRALDDFNAVARMYLQRFTRARDLFTRVFQRDLIAAFRHFEATGSLELITCGATHGYLPLLQQHPTSVHAQIDLGCAAFARAIGHSPAGMWNAECGYFPGLDGPLARAGISYFFTDAHGVLFGDPQPRRGVFAPVQTPDGVAVFARDLEASQSVWSSEVGYPGDHRYREFYRDIGFDLDEESLKPFNEGPHRRATGIKYYRITGVTDIQHKEPYREADAADAAAEHAAHFLFSRRQQLLKVSPFLDRPPLIVAPFDAELFGHWWFEGPRFLDILIRKMHFEQDELELITPSEYLTLYPKNQKQKPAASSWGNRGYNEVWLDEANDWIYRHLDQAARRMEELAQRFRSPSALERRALNQAGRELLLAQSSDWAFILKAETTVEYAAKRTRDHLHRFTRLYEQLTGKSVDEALVAELEYRDNIFPGLDYRVFG